MLEADRVPNFVHDGEEVYPPSGCIGRSNLHPNIAFDGVRMRDFVERVSSEAASTIAGIVVVGEQHDGIVRIAGRIGGFEGDPGDIAPKRQCQFERRHFAGTDLREGILLVVA